MAYLEMPDNPDTENIWTISFSYENSINIEDGNGSAAATRNYTGAVTVEVDINDPTTAKVVDNTYPYPSTSYISIPSSHYVQAFYSLGKSGLSNIQYDKLLQEPKTLQIICVLAHNGMSLGIQGMFFATVKYTINVNLHNGTGSIGMQLVSSTPFRQQTSIKKAARASHSNSGASVSANII